MMTRRTILAVSGALGMAALGSRAWARETVGLSAREIAARLGAHHAYAVGCADNALLDVGQPVVVEFARETRTLHIGGQIRLDQAAYLRQIRAAWAAMQGAARAGVTLDEIATVGRSRLDAPWRHAAAFLAGGPSDWHMPLRAGQQIALEAGAYAPAQRLGGRIRRTLRIAYAA